MTNLPSGTVTFLFTDIEGSTRLLQQLGIDRYAELLTDQRTILRAAFARHNGREIDTQGDSFFVSFPRATEAVAASVEIQRTLAAHDWPEGVEVRVRMGLHTGEPRAAEEGYVGMDVHRAARIASIGHGRQVLLSGTTAALIANNLPADVTLRDSGEHHLKDLRTPKRIFQLDIACLPGVFPPLRSRGRPNNLPLQATPFIGRVAELAALERLIADPAVRLITILGAGGMGKSRLALATAEGQLNALQTENGRQAPRFPHGAFFVSLASLASRDQIVPAIAEALDFRLESRESPASPGQERRSAREQLLDYLRNKQLLLVLDNYEHLLEGAGLALEILETAPGVQVLATSRERLGLQREQVFRLEGMTYPENGSDPEASYSAMVLFENRARLVRADFAVRAGEQRILGEICRLVGGMPLAIELAAAWVEALSLADIAAEIRRGLGILETEWSDVAERHRSVTAIFGSTYERLDEEERNVFRNASVFRGGFTRRAAEEITGASLRILTRLVHKTLLHYNRNKDRFEIHELLRQFGAEKLAGDLNEQKIQDRHSDFFCIFLADRERDIKGKRQKEAFAEIEAEKENILTAWNWAVKYVKVDRLDSAVGSLDEFLYHFGRDEERRDLYTQTVRHLDGRVSGVGLRVLVKLRIYQAAAMPWKESREALQIAQSCLEELENPEFQNVDVQAEKAKALQVLFTFNQVLEEYLKQANESISLYRKVGDLWSIGNILNSLGIDARIRSRFEDSKTFHKKCLAISHEIGDLGSIATASAELALTEIYLGNYEEAEKLSRESLSTHLALNNVRASINSSYSLGCSLNFLGRNVEARQALQNGIEIMEILSVSDTAINVLLGLVELDLGLYQEAERHGKTELDLEGVNNPGYSEAFTMFMLGKVAIVRRNYINARSLLERASVVFTQVGDFGILGDTQSNLASLYYFLGDTQEATRRYRAALETLLGTRFTFGACRALYGIALIYAEAGDLENALELQGLAETAPHVTNSQWMYDLFGRKIEAATERLSPETVAAAKCRGRERDLWETVEELLAELELENPDFQDLDSPVIDPI